MTQLDTTPEAAVAPASTRRRVLVTGGVVAAAAVVTAACGSTSTPPAGTPVSGGSGAGSGSTVSTADIPVGGGVVLEGKQVVITQPTAGTYKAFSAVCTHQGCIVVQVADGTITCPCHMGQFSAADGSVQGGPPPAPLAEVAITVSGTTITLA
jgi:Rieske Fe-S protein